MPASTLVPILIAVAAVLGAVLFALRGAKKQKQLQVQVDSHTKQKKQLEGKIKILTDEKQQVEGRLRKFEWDTVPRLREELKEIKTKSAQQVHDEHRKELERQTREQEQKIEQLTRETTAKEKQLQAALAARDAQTETVRREAAHLNGQIDAFIEREVGFWLRPLDDEPPKFEPLLTRHCPIISVVNLMPQVGKGTITANLGATLAKQDKRVLLIDLDPNRSLASLCCDARMPELLSREHRTIQHFFLWPSPDVRYLFNGLVQIDSAPNCHVLVNAEKIHADGTFEPDLPAAELQLLGKWLVDPTHEDIRFFLRKALHDTETRSRYDYVLLNCPPRFSTGCINALAASDFAIVPTLLNGPSATATVSLMRRFGQIRSAGLLKELRVLGVLANCAPSSDPASWPEPQKSLWTNLQASSAEALGQAVHFYKSAIPNSPSVAAAKANRDAGQSQQAFAAEFDDLKDAFAGLLIETTDRIDQERRQLART